MEKYIDIYSKGEYPANALSNFYPHAFIMDGVVCGSMEGFLQSLKYRSVNKQRVVCALVGKEAKAKGAKKRLWKWTGRVYWQGKRYHRNGIEFFELLTRAYGELYRQNTDFRTALKASVGATLAHTMGATNPKKTILTENEFIRLLIALQKEACDEK